MVILDINGPSKDRWHIKKAAGPSEKYQLFYDFQRGKGKATELSSSSNRQNKRGTRYIPTE